MAVSRKVKQTRHASITLMDASGFEEVVTLSLGDFSADRFTTHDRIAFTDGRGNNVDLGTSDRINPTGGWSMHLTELTDDSGSAGCVLDLIRRKGKYASAQSTWAVAAVDGYASDPVDAETYTLDVMYKVTGSQYGDSADQVVIYRDCVIETGFAESPGDSTKISCTFTCYGDVELTNQA